MVLMMRVNGVTPEILTKIHSLEKSGVNRVPINFSNRFRHGDDHFFLADEGEKNPKYLKYFWVSSSKLRAGSYTVEIQFRLRIRTMTKVEKYWDRKRDKDVVVFNKFLPEIFSLVMEMFPKEDSLEDPVEVKSKIVLEFDQHHEVSNEDSEASEVE